jgi:hypothetical protein
MLLRRRFAPARALFALLLMLGAALAAVPRPVAAADDGPAIEGFERTWSRTDEPSARGDRTFLWGPEPLVPLVITEPMAGLGLPGDVRPVLYWDKARMEVNEPTGDVRDQYYVTNGLLVSEMVQGRIQVGVNPLRYAERAPAEVPFGDGDDPTGPTYKSFAGVLGAAPLAVGQPVAQGIDRAGAVGAADAGGVTCAAVIAETKHCIAAPFWDFLNTRGGIFDYDAKTVANGALFDPLFYATGLPITEPYWITVRAGGKPTRVLLQLFERRTLTYNPANPVASRVEMGNVGLHYYGWRYTALQPGAPQTGLDPSMRAAIGAIADAGPKFGYLPAAVAGRYQLLFQDLSEDGAYGFASREYHLLVVDSGYATKPRGAGIILVHEMQHAYDFNTIGLPRNAKECYAFEMRGFLTEAYLWQTWHGTGGKSPITDPLEREENGLLKQIRENPTTFVNALIKAYTENKQCTAYTKTGTPDRLLITEGLPAGIAAELPVEQVFAALRTALASDGSFDAALADESSPFTITPR